MVVHMESAKSSATVRSSEPCKVIEYKIEQKSIVFLSTNYSSFRKLLVVQLLSHVPLFETPCTAIHQASLFFTIFRSLLKFLSIESMMPPTSHPLSSPSPALSLSQRQGLFQWAGSSHQVAKALQLHLQHQSFQWILRIDFFSDWLVWSLCHPRDSQGFSSTTVWKHQLLDAQPSLWSNSHIHTWLLGKR